MLRRLFATLCLLLAASGQSPAAVLPDGSIAKILANTRELTRSGSADSKDGTVLAVKGSDARGFVEESEADYGFLSNGKDVLIVPLTSEGSGGVFYALLFTGIAKKSTRFIGYIPSASGHLDVHIARGLLRVVTPIYKKSDANCCPSGHETITYTLEHSALKKLGESFSR